LTLQGAGSQATPGPGETPQSGTATVKLQDPNSKLNFRASASSSGQVIATIPHGATVEIVSYAPDWCAATYLGKSGYLSTAYLLFTADSGGGATATPPPGTPSPLPSSSPASGQLVVSATMLNLRASPNASAKIVAELPNGARLTLLEQLGDWYKVRWVTIEGYVSADHVQPVDSGSTNATPTPPPASATGSASPSATPAPTSSGTPVSTAKPVNTGVVTPVNGGLAIDGYLDCEDQNPSVRIPAGRKLDVLAYAGKDAEWCEVVFFGEQYFVRTEDLRLEHAVRP